MRGLEVREVGMKQKMNKRTLNPKLMLTLRLRATEAATTTVNGIIMSVDLAGFPFEGR